MPTENKENSAPIHLTKDNLTEIIDFLKNNPSILADAVAENSSNSSNDNVSVDNDVVLDDDGNEVILNIDKLTKK